MAFISSLFFPILTSIGSLALLYTAYSITRFLTFHLLTPSHPLQTYKRASPEPTYALITGSSAGIGLGVAQALVKQGFAIVLLGHLPEELAVAKTTLQKLRQDAVVKIVVLDCRTSTPEEIHAAVKSIEDLQISILVNNVGGNPITLPAFRTLSTYTIEDVDAVINMNARFMARFTALMLPILSRKPGPNERSLILNMSSAGKVGLPWIVMYGATKAFNWAFSHGLARELKASEETKHVDCLAIVPGDVRTQGNSEGVSESEPRWDEFGELIVRKVDNTITRGEMEMIPFAMHDIKNRILWGLPESVKTKALTEYLGMKRDAFNAVYQKER